MKISVKIVSGAILYLSIFILFLFKVSFVEAASETVSLEDYYVEMLPDGTLTRGKTFVPDKPVIRPAYTKSSTEAVNDIVHEDGKRAFKDVGYTIFFDKNWVLYYNNVGIYNNRPISYKIKFFTGPPSPSQYFMYSIKLNSDGSLNIDSAMSRGVGDAWGSYQLVYTDTKEVVKNVYVEFPQTITNRMSDESTINYSYNSFGLVGLKKVYRERPVGNIVPTVLSQMTGSESELDLLKVRMLPSSINEQQFIVVSDNEYPVVEGGFQERGALSTFHTIFKSDVKSPSIPNYTSPTIEGSKVADSFQANYSINQVVTPAYDKFYPDVLAIVLEDKDKLFSTFDGANIKISKLDGTDITSKVTIKKTSDGKLDIAIPRSLLIELQDNIVTVQANLTTIDTKKALTYYDSTSGSIKLPLTVNNVRKIGKDWVTSTSNTADAQIVPTILATAVPQKVEINSSTDDLNLDSLLTDIKSTIPGDKVKVLPLTKKVFDTVKKETITMKLQSELLPQLTQTIDVPVDVIDDVITSAFFENQAWIINNINDQLSPKQIDKDVYMSDLAKIKQINTDSTRPFPGQHIPKNIKYFQNLELLYLRNTKLDGNLPEELGKLAKMKDLRIFDNYLTGEIPKELGNLTNLEYLILDGNGLTGTVPKELGTLPNLHTLYLNRNRLVGQFPTFRDGFKILMVENNQLTYNTADVPSFLTSAVTKGYSKTFIGEMYLSGNQQIMITNPTTTSIKPFVESDPGYFALTAISSATKIPLYAEHVFKIIDEETKTVLYEGKADEKAEIPYKKGMTYKVILDNSDQNPKNVWIVKTKIPELKLDSVPSAMAFSIALGKDLEKPVQLTGKVSVFDNRENGHWQLSITPSTLNSDSRALKGEYIYIDSKGVEKNIVSDQKIMIESGVSDTVKEVIPISDNWGNKQGLQYKMNGSNYLGSYKGNVLWTLEDVPNSN
ncbi:hypothetical protein A5821_001254 [Enterococcus sp. 7F3_DIV0205]|uniref:WxL domain-containing protein n=1 Tax=Candidatus Enterococcus palustris TaxID=1834189 RepID=A0AAQ3Y752_9ENTE|nr:leucine-rich repeat domain-containing protein [Enterococcus sp. 7F3_DIV0205]OTN85652.1 hypothetical protein A5821_001598 [Enterococcus sp. 7F3_DIV0205]